MKRFLLLLLLFPFVSEAQFNFSFTNSTVDTTTYTDISGTGTVIPVTNPTAGASSSAQNIGFNFVFNGTTFTQFTIHADGVVRLGSTAPQASTTVATTNFSSHVAAFTTSNSNYTNLLMPFYSNLIAGSSTPEFHLLTSGSAPNRVCTIQFKHLADSTTISGVPNTMFSDMEFQVKLYETTNNIEFVYGTFTTGSGSDIFRFAAVGIKATSTNFVCASVKSPMTWNKAEFFNSILSEVTSMNFRKSNPPVPGFTFRFNGRRTNDVSVAKIFVDNILTKTSGVSSPVQAVIKNEGTAAQTNIPVTLTVTGANTASETINIASLSAGTTTTVSFTTYGITNTGTQDVQVSVAPTLDDNTDNNSRITSQRITDNLMMMADTSLYSTFGYGFSSGTGFVASKVMATGSHTINQLQPYFGSVQVRVKARIYEDNGTSNAPGTLLFTSSEFITGDSSSYLIPVNPPVTVTDNFYIAFEQVTSSKNMTFFGAMRNIIQPSRQYSSSTGSSWTETSNHSLFGMVQVREQTSGTDVGVEKFIEPGCTYNAGDSVSVRVRNLSSVSHDYSINPVTITGFAIAPDNSIINFTPIVRNSGTVAANAYDTIMLATAYSTVQRGRYVFSAKTSCSADITTINDSISFIMFNNINVTKSADSICPSTAVAMSIATSTYASPFSWSQNGTLLSSSSAINVSPIESTTYTLTVVDYRGCTLSDTTRLTVKTTGIPVKPQIIVTDSFLRGRTKFLDTLMVNSLSGHTFNWYRNGLYVGSDTSFISGVALQGNPEAMNVQIVRNSDGCTNFSDTVKLRYASGVLHDDPADLFVTDTSFYDNGGAYGTTINQNITRTYYPGIAGNKVQLSFYLFSIANFGTVRVYDGNSSSAPLLETLNGSSPPAMPVTYTSSDSTGALTVEYNHTGPATGWLAHLTCIQPLEYRSIGSGNWHSAAIWESRVAGSNGAWTAATRATLKADSTVTIQSGQTVTIQSQTGSADNIYVAAGGSLIFAGSTALKHTSNTTEIEADGNVTVNGGVQLFGSGTMIIRGNLDNSGSIDLDNVTFSGNSQDTLSGNGNVKYLNLNTAAGLYIPGSPSTDLLTFIRGLITVNSGSSLSIRSSGGINGASDTTYVSGALTRSTFCNASDFFFPIGKGGVYRPVQLTGSLSGCDDTKTVRVELFNSTPPINVLPITLDSICNTRYYHIEKLVGSFTVNVSLQYGAGDFVPDASQLRIAKDDGAGNWIDLGGLGTANNTGEITSTNGFSTFSDFVLAKFGGIVLPVNTNDFIAEKKGLVALLRWTVDEPLQQVVVERSNDAVIFQTLMELPAREGHREYHCTDEAPVQGQNFYRVRYVQQDGTTLYSATRKLNFDAIGNTPALYPNPATDMITVQHATAFTRAEILQMNGIVVRTADISDTKQIDVKQLPAGVYMVKLYASEQTVVLRFTKQ